MSGAGVDQWLELEPVPDDTDRIDMNDMRCRDVASKNNKDRVSRG